MGRGRGRGGEKDKVDEVLVVWSSLVGARNGRLSV